MDFDDKVFKYRKCRKVMNALKNNNLVSYFKLVGMRGSHMQIESDLGKCTLVRGHGSKKEIDKSALAEVLSCAGA